MAKPASLRARQREPKHRYVPDIPANTFDLDRNREVPALLHAEARKRV